MSGTVEVDLWEYQRLVLADKWARAETAVRDEDPESPVDAYAKLLDEKCAAEAAYRNFLGLPIEGWEEELL